jgi:CubicO group peptidase (beta-lactamase class C family)
VKRVSKVGLTVVALILIAVALWFFRPWSEYSPYKIVAFRSAHTEAQWFANFHKVLPSRRIAPSESPRQWPRTPQELNITYEWEGEQKTLRDYMAQTGVTGFMVLQDGAIAYEHYANGSMPETRNMIWSVAKSYTVTILGLALKEGVIKSLDDTVEIYAPRFKGTAYGETSIRHVAMMSSGMNFGPNDKWGPISLWAKTYFDLTARQFDMDDVAADMDRLTPPGIEFRYRFPDTHVISAVLRGAYAESYGGKVTWAQLMEDKLWQPFGFGGEAFWVISPADEEGTSWGHAGVSMRLLELAQLGQVYLDNGVPYGEAGGQSRFTEEWVDGVSKPNARFQEPALDSFYPHQGYSRQFWIPQDYDGEFMALGGFDQVVWIDLKRNAVIAQTAAGSRHGGVSPLEQFKVFRAVVAASSIDVAHQEPATGEATQ